MKIFRLSYNYGALGEISEEMPEFDNTEAIKLKDGRIFYMSGMNHWPLMHRLKGMEIGREQYAAIGWVDSDGVFKSKVSGDSQISEYFLKTKW